jgi:uncharacterized protein YPO0396
MATNQASMARRQRERQRQQRRREKAAKRQERRDAKAEAGTVDLDDTIDWESAIREEIIETDEDSEVEAEAG